MRHAADGVFRPTGPEVIFKYFGDETVVANLNTGLFYSLSGSAVGLWQGLVSGCSVRQLAEAFAATGPADAAATIEQFVNELVAQNLIVLCETPSTSVAALPDLGAFAPPTFERFDDLQGLLLVDPIHDVTEAGWPARSPDDPDAPGA